MDVDFNNFFHRIEFILSKRLQNLQKNYFKKIRYHLFSELFYLGLIFLFFALILGYLAYKKTQYDSLKIWKKKNQPSLTMLKEIFKNKGMKPLTQLSTLHQVYRSLPVKTGHTGSFWISENNDWIAFYSEKEGPLEVHIFYFPESILPKNRAWQPIGEGWEGLEAILEKVNLHKPKKENIKKNKDPRSIEY